MILGMVTVMILHFVNRTWLAHLHTTRIQDYWLQCIISHNSGFLQYKYMLEDKRKKEKRLYTPPKQENQHCPYSYSLVFMRDNDNQKRKRRKTKC